MQEGDGQLHQTMDWPETSTVLVVFELPDSQPIDTYWFP